MTGLTLAHNQNGLSLEFAALTYANPSKIRYRFRLDGLEKQWTTVDAQQRNARYTGLRPGEYVFRVQASTDGGVNWGEQGASLRLDIAPPWWNTPMDQVRRGPGIHVLDFRYLQVARQRAPKTAVASGTRWWNGGQRNLLRPVMRRKRPIKERKKPRP